MSNYPPPPPPDQHHYASVYPNAAGAQQVVDPMQQGQLQYGNLNQSVYPRVETTPSSTDESSIHIHHTLAQELQRHTEPDDHTRQRMRQVPLTPEVQQNQQQNYLLQQPPQHIETAAEQAAKANRLRKACDSCSIRKVKVSCFALHCALGILLTVHKVRRKRSPVPRLCCPGHPLHIRATQSQERPAESPCRSHQAS